MTTKLPREAKKRAVASLQRYARERLETEMGNLDAELLLDFFVTEIGPVVYNQALRDAQTFLQEKMTDLESVCYQAEETYWLEPPRGSRR